MLDTLEKPDFVHQTFIRCSQDALWDALTKADQIAAHHFACNDATGDAAVGVPSKTLGSDGSTMLTQTTLVLDPKSRIEQTFEPNWPGVDKTPSRVVFLIEAEGDHCKLTVEHYELPEEEQGVREGWARFSASLKSWIETGEPIKLER